MTALNDLAVGGTAGYPTRLATANSSFLQTDSSGNISWGAAPSGGGMSNPMVATGDVIMDVDKYLLR